MGQLVPYPGISEVFCDGNKKGIVAGGSQWSVRFIPKTEREEIGDVGGSKISFFFVTYNYYFLGLKKTIVFKLIKA